MKSLIGNRSINFESEVFFHSRLLVWGMEKNEILHRSFQFSLKIIRFCEVLEEKRKYVIARQLLRSGTSIGANIREAQHPHSRKDFISKCIVAAKEANETEYWLHLTKEAANLPDPGELVDEIVVIKKLLSRIISSAKKNSK